MSNLDQNYLDPEIIEKLSQLESAVPIGELQKSLLLILSFELYSKYASRAGD